MVRDTGKAEAMQEGRDGRGQVRDATADDNGGPETRVGDAVLCLARLLGRQIAREQFARLEAANDNAPGRIRHRGGGGAGSGEP